MREELDGSGKPVADASRPGGPVMDHNDIWIRDCMDTRGMVLTGKLAHYCIEWDDLPTDETCPEFEHCHCFPDKPAREDKALGESAKAEGLGLPDHRQKNSEAKGGAQ